MASTGHRSLAISNNMSLDFLFFGRPFFSKLPIFSYFSLCMIAIFLLLWYDGIFNF
jgi:hypothetical protein